MQKLLWTASSALQSKQINREHEKFKEYMSNLCKLVKKMLMEFYHPSRSMSAQMAKFSNLMVFYVIQGKPLEEIYSMTKSKLEAQNPMKISGYIAPEDYAKNHYIRKNSSLLMYSNSFSTLNISSNSEIIVDNNFNNSGSDTSLNRSSSKNNDSNALRENYLSLSRENSSKKMFGGSEPNLAKISSSTNSNLLKAKRQISF